MLQEPTPVSNELNKKQNYSDYRDNQTLKTHRNTVIETDDRNHRDIDGLANTYIANCNTRCIDTH